MQKKKYEKPRIKEEKVKLKNAFAALYCQTPSYYCTATNMGPD